MLVHVSNFRYIILPVYQVCDRTASHLYCIVKKGLPINFVPIILKMADKGGHPVGSFKLNPLNMAKVNKDTDGAFVENSMPYDKMGVENVDMASSERKQNITKNIYVTTSNVTTSTDYAQIDKLDDSAVMMKMVISGPPNQAKKQKVLPETLLQKVTDIVRHQTITTDSDVSKCKQIKPEMETSKDHTACMFEMGKDSYESSKKKHEADLGASENLTPELVISHPVVQSVDSCNETQSSNNNHFVQKKSCADTDSDKASGGRAVDMTTELKEQIDMIAEKVENIEHVEEICGPPMPSKSDNLSKNINGEKEIIESEAEVDPFGGLFLDEGVNHGDKAGMNVEAKLDTNETEINPFGSLFLEELDSNKDKVGTKKESDEVYNIAPLFTGELEKWRKRELKKEKKKIIQKKKGKKSADIHPEEGSSKKDGKKAENKDHAPIPNYFVAIQITNPQIHAGIKRVQDDVVSGNEKLKPALNKLATLHLTMFVVHLQTDDEMTRAKCALDQCQKKLESVYRKQPLSLDVSGLGNFRNSVVFAKVRTEEQVAKLKEIADIVEDCFLDQEIVSTEKSGSFKPHITVMKLTRDRSFRKKGGIKKIDEALYKKQSGADFGHQYVNTLQLCAMLKKKAETGYYQVEHTVKFGPDLTDSHGNESKDILDFDLNDKAGNDIKDLLDELITKVVAANKPIEFNSGQTRDGETNNIRPDNSQDKVGQGDKPPFVISRSEKLASLSIAQNLCETNVVSKTSKTTEFPVKTVVSNIVSDMTKCENIHTVDKVVNTGVSYDIDTINMNESDNASAKHSGIPKKQMQEEYSDPVSTDNDLQTISDSVLSDEIISARPKENVCVGEVTENATSNIILLQSNIDSPKTNNETEYFIEEHAVFENDADISAMSKQLEDSGIDSENNSTLENETIMINRVPTEITNEIDENSTTWGGIE